MLLPFLATICSRGMVFKMKEIITHYDTDGNDSVEQEKLIRQEREGRTGRAALTGPCIDKVPCISEGAELS